MHDHTSLTTGNPQIRYWSTAGEGPRVLLVMGYCMRGDIWRPQIEGLRADHQVAWYDHRGLGESERGPKKRWTIADMAGDAISVMDGLNWDTAHLVGVSMGGMIAQEMALAAQERFNSLTLIATNCGGPLPRKIPPLKGLKAFLGANVKRGEERLEAIRHLLYPDDYFAVTDQGALRERVRLQLGRPVPRSTQLAHLYAVGRHDTRKRLKHISLPTLIMKAGQDILVRPAASDRLKKRIPHADFLEISDAGHGIIFQSADQVNSALRGHFASVT